MWQALVPLTHLVTMAERKSLAARLIGWTLIWQLILMVVVFVPAGTWKFWPGWAYLGVNLVGTIHFCVYFYRRDPQLLERRLLRKETVKAQKIIMRLLRLLNLIVLTLPGLDFRFGWSRQYLRPVPWWLMVPALGVVLACHCWFVAVMNANRFAASVIQVEAGQTVMDTGPYRMVRHPMYFGGVVLLLSAPLALGSFVAWPAFALLIPFLALRLLNEEKFLRRELPGYAEYCRRTRYRLVPFVW